MKVLILASDSYAGFGGVAQYNRDVVDSLNLSSEVSEIVSITRNTKQTDVELPSRLTEYNITNKVWYVLSTVWSVLKWKPDIIICTHVNLLCLTSLSSFFCKAKVILEIYGIEAWTKKSRMTNICLKKVDRIISISRYTRRKFLSWGAVSEHSIDIVPNAIHLDKYSKKAKPIYLLDRYHVKGCLILLTLGRLSAEEQYKGHDRIIELMPRLVKMFPNLIYIIAGDGDDRMRLKSLVKNMNVESFVKFVGRIDEGEIIDHYCMADAFAMPSTGEGFGFVFLEAAACGVPVLGGRVDGSADALLDGDIGITVDPFKKEDLFEGLVELLKLDNKIDAVDEKIKNFSFGRFSQQIQSIISMVNKQDE